MARSNPDIDLVATTGAIEGVRVQLQPRETLLLGRAANGLQIPDELVSIYHAEVTWDQGGYWVADLSSATGTFVDDRKLSNEKVRLQVGNVIRVGDTRLRVSTRRRFTALEILAIVLPLLIAGAFVVMATMMGPRGTAANELPWSEPIRRGPMVEATTRLEVAPSFLRANGLSPSQLKIRRVTDLDRNAVDEVWIRGSEREWMVTFEADGAWYQLGELPIGCMDAALADRTGTMPLLRCPGVLYDMTPNGYAPVQQDGVVVWLVPKAIGEAERLLLDSRRNAPVEVPIDGVAPSPLPPGAGSGVGSASGPAPGLTALGSGASSRGGSAPPAAAPQRKEDIVAHAFDRPHRVAVGSEERLAGFLAERGVDQPVHYLVCENALTGLAPQVLLASGEIRALDRPCGDDVRLNRDPALVGRPGLVAFTAQGHQALVRDVLTFFGGSPDALYLDPGRAGDVAKLQVDPALPNLAVQVEWGEKTNFFRPVAAERALPAARMMLAVDGAAAARPAVSARLLTAGVATLDPPGCSLLEVKVDSFVCQASRGCLPGTNFLTVDETGCGERSRVLSAGYRSAVVDGRVGGVEVRSVVELDEVGSTVRRARVAWRPAAATE